MTDSIWTKELISDIRKKSETGRYLIKGFGSNRKYPSFDDLVFLPAQLSRLAIDTYREPCSTKTVLGARFAERPLKLDTPVVIAALSHGAVSREAKIALAIGSTLAGTASNTGAGGMLPEEREKAKKLFYQCFAGRYNYSVDVLLNCDCIELMVGQGAKPGTGGHLLADKLTEEISTIRGVPAGIDLRSPTRHPDIMGADDLVIKIQELREATDWKVPICVKIAAGRVQEDVKLASKCGADIIAIDGMEGGTGAGPELLADNVGIPTLSAVPLAMAGLEESGLTEEVDIIVMGGIRNGADAAKALALGADAVAIGRSAMIAMGCTCCGQCHTNRCPTGICTQDPKLRGKFDVNESAMKVANFIKSMTSEIEMFTKIAGKTDVHNLEYEDLRAITITASEITGVPLAGKTIPAKKVKT